VLLVDLDDHNPSLARRLGFPLVPNVLDALAAVTAGQPPEEAIAQRHTNAVGEVAFHAITGLAHPSDWARLRDLPTLLTQAANRWHYVVIDTGPSCAADQTPPGSNRHATTRTAITAADHVIAVGNGTRSGVLRLLDWASSAAELVSQRSVLVAVNRAPRDRYRRDQIQDQLHTHLGEGLVRTIEYLPFDPAVFRADWDAAVPTRGPFVDGIDTLAHRLRPAPTRHSSRRRLIGASR
jgi:cellulose biosynthesis protein BcsQ